MLSNFPLVFPPLGSRDLSSDTSGPDPQQPHKTDLVLNVADFSHQVALSGPKGDIEAPKPGLFSSTLSA